MWMVAMLRGWLGCTPKLTTRQCLREAGMTAGSVWQTICEGGALHAWRIARATQLLPWTHVGLAVVEGVQCFTQIRRGVLAKELACHVGLCGQHHGVKLALTTIFVHHCDRPSGILGAYGGDFGVGFHCGPLREALTHCCGATHGPPD